MSRYTGPRARVSRRLNTNIFGTKGERAALERRAYPPGQHGHSRRRTTPSDYLLQLQEKQKARFTYGLNERQFRNLYKKASRSSGVTGENMLIYLETRLDNVVFRSRWGATRPQARQFVLHGHVLVDGKRVNIPSYRVSAGQVVSLPERFRENAQVRWNVDLLDRVTPLWLEVSADGWESKVLALPTREQIDEPIRENLVVELYSK